MRVLTQVGEEITVCNIPKDAKFSDGPTLLLLDYGDPKRNHVKLLCEKTHIIQRWSRDVVPPIPLEHMV